MAQSTDAMTVELPNNSSPAPREIMSAAFEALRQAGFDGLRAGDLEPPAHKGIDGGVTPAFADDVRLMDNAGAFDGFDLRDELEGAAGDVASSHVTTVFVRAEKTVAGTVRDLCDRGHVGAAVDKVADELTGDVDISLLPDDETARLRSKAVDMVSYYVATVAKGWVAEQLITATDAFAKGSMSNDEAEQDVRAYADGDFDAPYFQVKSVTLGYKPNGTIESTDADGQYRTVKRGVPVLFYQWDCDGGLVVGLNYKAVNGQAADAKDMAKTTLGRTHSSYTFDGRTYRYLWW